MNEIVYELDTTLRETALENGSANQIKLKSLIKFKKSMKSYLLKVCT